MRPPQWGHNCSWPWSDMQTGVWPSFFCMANTSWTELCNKPYTFSLGQVQKQSRGQGWNVWVVFFIFLVERTTSTWHSLCLEPLAQPSTHLHRHTYLLMTLLPTAPQAPWGCSVYLFSLKSTFHREAYYSPSPSLARQPADAWHRAEASVDVCSTHEWRNEWISWTHTLLIWNLWYFGDRIFIE